MGSSFRTWKNPEFTSPL